MNERKANGTSADCNYQNNDDRRHGASVFDHRDRGRLRINGTHSLPVGLYLATSKRPEKGDLVFLDPPSLPLFALAKERGYLGAGFSPAGCGALIKRLAGVSGDRITIDAAGVEVNGIRLANSTPRTFDGAGRPIKPYLLKNYILGQNEVLLMSEYSPISFDARYFGHSVQQRSNL